MDDEGGAAYCWGNGRPNRRIENMPDPKARRKSIATSFPAEIAAFTLEQQLAWLSTGLGVGERRGSSLAAVLEGGTMAFSNDAGNASTISASSAAGLHPGLARMAGAVKRAGTAPRKSMMQGANAVDELGAAMDSLAARLQRAVDGLQQQNTAGLAPQSGPQHHLGKAGLGEAVQLGSVRGEMQQAADVENAAAQPSSNMPEHTIASTASDLVGPAGPASCSQSAQSAAGGQRQVAKTPPGAQNAVNDAPLGGARDTLSLLAAAAAKPGRTGKEDVAALRSWLQSMLLGMIKTADTGATAVSQDMQLNPAGVQSAAQLAEAALPLYCTTFHELQRLVAVESNDRANLLGSIWTHCLKLVELRSSLNYEAAIWRARGELEAGCEVRNALLQQVQDLEAVVAGGMQQEKQQLLEKDEEEIRHAQLLAIATEESEQRKAKVEQLTAALASERSKVAVLERSHDEIQEASVSLRSQRDALAMEVRQQGEALTTAQEQLTVLRNELHQSREAERALSEGMTRLEVQSKRAGRDLQTTEIMCLSVKEQLHARVEEVAQLQAATKQATARQQAAVREAERAVEALHMLRAEHDMLLAASDNARMCHEEVLAGLQATAKDWQLQAEAAQDTCRSLENALKVSVAHEAVAAEKNAQLAAAHTAQDTQLRQEVDIRRGLDDELQALRAGLQVTQQRLEGLGIVFSSSAVHRTSAEAWQALGPLSLGRQVVASANNALGELAAQQRELAHAASVAKERWQTEEAVRIKVQEQLLEARASASKLDKDNQALEAVVTRLERQRDELDKRTAQLCSALTAAEERVHAAHKQGLEVAAEAKRLTPFELHAVQLEAQLAAAQAGEVVAQRAVSAHQSTIKDLLDSQAKASRELAARSEALLVAQAQIKELTVASSDRGVLAVEKERLEAHLHELREQCVVHEQLQQDAQRQLALAKQLLVDTHSMQERERLGRAEADVRRYQAAAMAKAREAELLQARLASMEQQLAFSEEQLHVMVHSSTPDAGSRSRGLWPEHSAAVVDQLRKLLELREDRLCQLDRLHTSLVTSTTQLRQLQAQVAARDATIAQLHAEVQRTQKRLHQAQEHQLKVATKDMVALASTAGMAPEVVQGLLREYLHRHLRSELVWTKAKLAFVSHMARNLRLKLRFEEEARAKAELESVCVEAFYLQQAVLDQRAAASLFDTTVGQARQALLVAASALAEVQQQLVGPACSSLDQLRQAAGVAAAGLTYWLERFTARQEASVQAGSLELELEPWQQLLTELQQSEAGQQRDALQPREVGAAVVCMYAHSLQSIQRSPTEDRPLATIFESLADFFCHCRGYKRQDMASPHGPVGRLLAGVQSCMHHPRAQLLARLAGLTPGAGPLAQPPAWRFLLHILHCLSTLNGHLWPQLLREWGESEGGVGLPLACMMDVLANLYNTDAPALLDVVRRSLLPLVRQGRRGPAIDLDALLLVIMAEFDHGACPVAPLLAPRRLTDGTVAAGALVQQQQQEQQQRQPSGPPLVYASVPAMAQAGPYPPLASMRKQDKSPMRRRIVNLAGDTQAGTQAFQSELSSTLPPVSRSPELFKTIQGLAQVNADVPVGLRSQLRASSPIISLPGS